MSKRSPTATHAWEVGERQGIHLVNLPAVGYHFRDQDPVGWVVAGFANAGVELTLRAFAGNTAEDRRKTVLRWA